MRCAPKLWDTTGGDGAHFGLDASPLRWSLGGAVHPGHLAAIRTQCLGRERLGRNVCPSYKQVVCKSSAPNSKDA